jgi:hypothetical protein
MVLRTAAPRPGADVPKPVHGFARSDIRKGGPRGFKQLRGNSTTERGTPRTIFINTELQMRIVLGILPKDLRSKVQSKLMNEDGCDEATRIIMEELQDFVTGRVW